MKHEAGHLLVVIVLVALCSVIVLAQNFPTAPATATPLRSSTFNPGNYQLQPISALAGNITELSIYSISQTKAWQGYWGNVSGTITLDDAFNFTFYNWSAADPRGEVYATLNTTIDWANIECYDFSNGAGATWATIESYYGIGYGDSDGINETYTLSTHTMFEVGAQSFSTCPATYAFQSDAAQSANFLNVLLYDPALPNTGWVYTALIENKTFGAQNDLPCYNGDICDFQILVNEDGHGNNTASTTYYFWVELS